MAVVIREIDVVLTNALIDKLLLLQYPSRPLNRLQDDKEVLCAKIKPRQQKIEIQMGLNMNSRCYDRSKAEQIALNTDGADVMYGSDETYFNSSHMDKQVLTSTKTSLPSGCYAVGRFSEGRLHLSPVTSVLQMHPSYNYLDKGYTLGQIEAGLEEKKEVQAVTVKFAGPNAEKAKKAREKSFSYLLQKSEAEPWIAVNYNALGSQVSKLEYQKLLCTPTHNESSNVSMSSRDHIQTLVPECLLQKPQALLDSESLSIGLASTLTEQLRSIMINAQVLKFDQLMELLPKEQSSNVEKILQQIAILVQGCWVVKSDVLYQKDSISPFTGVSADVLIRTRDYILWSFTKSRYFTRADVLSVIQVPYKDISHQLSQVAKKVYNKGWEFKYPYDQEFIENHPKIVERQDMLWHARYRQLIKDLQTGQMAATDSSPKKSFPPPPSPKEMRHFKYRESFSGDDTEESGAESSSSEKMEVECSKKGRLFRRTSGGRKGFSPVKNGSRCHHLSANAFDMPSNFLSALPSVEIKSELVRHCKDVLYERFCLTLGELKESLAEASMTYIAQREDCDSLLEEVLTEIGAQRLKNKWPQNTQPAALYAFTKFGTTLDRYREALLDLFTGTARSRPNFLIKKVEDENGEIISENVCRQIFEEYCLYKAGYFYLKGTITADS